MRGIFGRSLRLELIFGLSAALALPALALAAETPGQATQTTLSAETRDQGGRTQATVAIAVVGEDGLPATGAVAIRDHGREVAGVALNAQGQAKTVLALPAGNHTLRAVYQGDGNHLASTSPTAELNAEATAEPDFAISVAPATLSLTPGQDGTITATVTPINPSALTAPMFVTLSCSGLPDEATCNFTPANIEIQANTPTSCAAGATASTCPLVSTLVIETVKATSASAKPIANPIALAVLFPGALGLLGLAWGGRRRRWLSRVSLIALVGLVTMLGTTACNPRYAYLNHGPIASPATPAGSYTITVAAQSSNGITATTHTTTMALTVQ